MKFYGHFAAAYGTISLLLLALSLFLTIQGPASRLDYVGLVGFPLIALIYALIRTGTGQSRNTAPAAAADDLCSSAAPVETSISRSKLVAIGLLVALVGALLGVLATRSFLRPLSPSATSAFYSACSNWSAVLDKSNPDNNVTVKNVFPGGGRESVDPEKSYRNLGMNCYLSINNRGIDQFMSRLQNNLVKLAQQTGAEIDDGPEAVSERSGDMVFHSGFEIQYTAKNAHGTIKVNAEKAIPEKPGIEMYHLRVQMEEWVR